MINSNWSLSYFLDISNKSENYQSNDQIIYLFYFGLEKFLLAISSVISASFLNSESSPPGFTGKFARCFNKPVLGTLLNDYIFTTIKDCDNPSITDLKNYFFETERKDGWISKMISLRNNYFHPKDKSPDEIIDDAKLLLNNIPDFSILGYFNENDRNIIWESKGSRIKVTPFLYVIESELFVFKEFDKSGSLIFNHDNKELDHFFKEEFNKLRIQDSLLENPGREDIIKRIKPISNTNEKPSLWWFGKLMKSMNFLNLVDKDLLIPVLSSVNNEFPCLIVELDGKGQLLEMIAEQLGLMKFKDNDEFLNAFQGGLVYIGIITNNIGVKDFASLINWIIAVCRNEASKDLRFIIERPHHILVNDQQKLSGRLPEELNEILGGPSGLFKDDLIEIIWNKQTRKKFIFF
jgi:hypothetical protein